MFLLQLYLILKTKRTNRKKESFKNNLYTKMKNDTSISSACAYSNGNITDPEKDLEGIYFISLIPT